MQGAGWGPGHPGHRDSTPRGSEGTIARRSATRSPPSVKGALPSCPNYPWENRLRAGSQVPTLGRGGTGSLPPPLTRFYRESTDTPRKVGVNRGGADQGRLPVPQ